MNKKLLLLLFSLIIVFFVAFVLWKLFITLEKSAEISSINSLSYGIVDTIFKDYNSFKDGSLKAPKLDSSYSGFYGENNSFIDKWGTEYKIYLNKSGNKLDCSIISAGPDKTFKTLDDIFFRKTYFFTPEQ